MVVTAVNVGIVSILQGDESGGNHRAADLDEQAEQDWNYRLPITGGSARHIQIVCFEGAFGLQPLFHQNTWLT